jgi:hypothetical protein
MEKLRRRGTKHLQEALLTAGAQHHVDAAVSQLLETEFDKFLRDMGGFFA